MLWTLLIWVVVGLVMMSVVWPIGVLARADKNGYDFERYMKCMVTVLDEDDADTKARYNVIKRFIFAVLANVFWPNKIIYLTREFIPKFDELYIDLTLESLKKGEHA